jgi:hypothetical protein
MQGSQRINIQYSINMDELPAEVTRVYKKSLAQVRNIELPEIAESEILNSSVIKLIDEARQNLANADIMLGDVQSIVNAYVEYELSVAAANAAPPEQPPGVPENNENPD